MGSVLPYASAKGKRYRVVYRRPDNSQGQKRGFTTKRDAELYLAQVETSKARGDYINPTDAKIVVATLGAEWLEGRRAILKPSTFHSVESTWRVHVQPKWGKRAIGGVRHSEVQTWVSDLNSRYSATTVLRAHGIIAAILDSAVRDKRLTRNPARDVTLPKKLRATRAYLTHPQVAALAATSRFPTIIYTLAYTGLRWGELAGLRVGNVDFARRRLLVEENAVQVNATIHVGSTKTGRARSVPFPPFLAESLRSACGHKSRDQLVFSNVGEHLRRPQSHDGWFAAAVRRAQADDPAFPRISPHDLRHTAASLAISAGANVKAVQRMLGHASATMTLDTYADLFDDDLNRVSDALDRARYSSVVANMMPNEGPTM